MADNLTEQQKVAVTDRGGPLLVSAAAGSGKTKVLVDRLISYILDPVDPANIDDFLIITYTHAAAAELRGKIATKLSEHISVNPANRHLQQQMQRLYLAKISTVHSFCADVIKEFAYMLDVYGDFRVADENECLELQQTAMEKVLNDAYASIASHPEIRTLIDTQGFGRDDSKIAEIILKVYSSAKCHLDPDGWLDSCVSSANLDTVSDASETKWGKYLMDEFHNYLQLQMEAIRNVTESAASAENMEKPYALLQDTLDQLKNLYQQTMWDGIVANKNIDYGTLTFSKKCQNTELIAEIKAVRDACKKGLTAALENFSDYSATILREYGETSVSLKGMVFLTKQFSEEYEHLKRNRRVLDFSDLEHRTLDLLMGRGRKNITKLAREIGNRFREVMVDEYQDSNAVQDAIFTSLTEERGNCFMVGDVKQSIYQFRLADPDIFLKKYETFVPAENATAKQGRKVLLSKNFRSCSAVIDAVNDVFYTCMTPSVGGLQYTDDEALNVGVTRCEMNEPEIELCAIDVQDDTYAEESAYIAQRIASLLDGTHYVRKDKDTVRPITPGDIVILLRSPGSVGAYYRRALQNIGIPCTTDRTTDLLQEEEVSVLISLLQTINNPLQDISLVATLSSRIFMFSADDLAKIRGKNKKCSFYDALKQDTSEKTKEFLCLLTQLRELARSSGIVQLIEHIFTLTRMDSIFASMPDGEMRVENLHSFCHLASSFENNCSYGLSEFIANLNRLSERGYFMQDTKDANNAVTIMSIHKSKGLEFPVVFLSGLSRDFNRKSAREQVLCDKDLGIGLFCVDVVRRIRYPSIARRAIASKILAEGLSEEMRILYVAMTRASDRLIMTYASNRLQKELNALALRMNRTNKELLIREADCPGEWVLLTALGRTESGALFDMLDCNHNSECKPSPWLVSVVDSVSNENGVAGYDETSRYDQSPNLHILKSTLAYIYPYKSATITASKQTATQLKGRLKDQEASQNAGNQTGFVRQWRSAEFIENRKTGAIVGTLVHKVMQFISLDHCSTLGGIVSELDRLVLEGYITTEERQIIDSDKIFKFFCSSVGKKVISAKTVLREFKFSILDDGSRYSPNLDNEKVLLQGVVDCAVIEDDGITVIDFKTDSVSAAGIDELTRIYEQQINIYADALSRIYELPIKAKYIYYFNFEQFFEI